MIKLFNKQIILGVCGGIAAYKSAEIVRLLQQAGASVQVIMTQSAKEFITPLTFQALSGHRVYENTFDEDCAMEHIALARVADAIIVAPATAHTLAEIAHGKAGELLTSLLLAARCPRLVAPAMNQQMWHDPATQHNINILKDLGYRLVGPASGEQACGDIGLGRMEEPAGIVQAVASCFELKSLSGKRVLITAGPTHEAIDPVRYIGNHSSGKMAQALAQAAVEAGAAVTVISGPVKIDYPNRAEVISVVSAKQMHDSVMQHCQQADIFIAAAAVADYRCEDIAKQKIKKVNDRLELRLIKNKDILADVCRLSPRPLCVGFSAETENVIEHAQQKRQQKDCDIIIANRVGVDGSGFSADRNEVTIITNASQHPLAMASKSQIARDIIEFIAHTKE